MLSTARKNNNRLGVYSLTMIAIVSVDSLRNLPISAQYGFPLITFYLIAGLTFFLPLAWITAKLTKAHPNTGGSYVWIEKAFGPNWGYISIWLQWIYNMIWYPTIFTFINTILASLIFPELTNNKWFILSTSLGLFWIISSLHCLGIRTSRWISAFGTIIGTLLPMGLIIGLAAYTLLSGQTSATPFNGWSDLIPNAHSLKNLAFFSNILFSVLGLEVIAMHAGNVNQPHQTYPRALGLSSLLILSTLTFSSLALCIILPADKIALTSGLVDVFHAFFNTYHLPGAGNIIAICIIIGGLATASSWMIGLARGMHTALSTANAPLWLQRSNKHHMPVGILILPGMVYTVLICAYLLSPNISNAYWMLSALTAQFALAYYLLLFFAAITLLRQQKISLMQRRLSILLPSMGCGVCLFGIGVGFLPPDQMAFGSTFKYEFVMVTAFVSIALLPIFLLKTINRYRLRKLKAQSIPQTAQ